MGKTIPRLLRKILLTLNILVKFITRAINIFTGVSGLSLHILRTMQTPLGPHIFIGLFLDMYLLALLFCLSVDQFIAQEER